MSNTIGWGKGASNNSIGWGNVGTNGFGSIYSRSNSGETDLAGEASIFQDAAVAYSLRDLGLGAEQVVRVRRSTDNAEEDFSATEITDGTLTTFCGVGNGFVSVWYNQTGDANAIQPTASRQPRIVNAGVLETKLGKPAIYMTSGINLFLNDSTKLLGGDGIRSFVVFSVDNVPTSNKGIFGKWGGTVNEFAFLSSNFISPAGLVVISRNDSNVQTNTASGTELSIGTYLLEADFNNNFQKIFLNSNEIASQTITSVQNSDANFSIGTYNANNASLTTEDSYYQDFIIFQAQNTGIKEEIRQNINNHYGIY